MGLSPPLSSGLEPESSSGQKFSSSSSDGPREGGVEGQRLRYLLCPLCADLLLTEVEIHQARVLSQPTRRLSPAMHTETWSRLEKSERVSLSIAL